MQSYFNRSFQIGSKTILNTINTCLLNLFSPTNKNNNDDEDIKEKTSSNINYYDFQRSFLLQSLEKH